jgi:hypothetical protein
MHEPYGIGLCSEHEEMWCAWGDAALECVASFWWDLWHYFVQHPLLAL